MDREKVIKGLELCEIGSGDRCYETECPYYGQECTEGLKSDIIAILKEQDAQSVLSNRVCEAEQFRYVRKGFCPKCHQEMEWLFNRKHCGFCGQAVKWDE